MRPFGGERGKCMRQRCAAAPARPAWAPRAELARRRLARPRAIGVAPQRALAILELDRPNGENDACGGFVHVANREVASCEAIRRDSTSVRLQGTRARPERMDPCLPRTTAG